MNEIEENINKLKAIVENEKLVVNKDFQWSIEKMLNLWENDSYLIGKSIGICERISLKLRCAICKQIIIRF